MSTTTLTMENFQDTISSEGIVLVDFWADWCGPCHMFAPVFENASEKHSDVTFAKVDTEAEQQLAMAARIMSIPTLMAFRDGVLLFNQAGALPQHALEDLIGKIREVDMDDVRRQVAEQKASAQSEPGQA